MDRLSIVTLGAAKAYTNASIAGGGAIKGKNCQIKSSTPITGGTRIVFAWYLDNGTEQTTTVDVMDGVDGAKGDTGLGVKSASIVESHLILVMDDDTTVDAGLVSGFDTDMSHITDINLSGLTDGQILKYNAITRMWENASAGTVDTSLVDLNDVDVDNLTDGQIIVWDATAGRWKNANNSPSITVDPTPTQGSNNAVASGGVYAALQGKADSTDVPTKTSDLTNDSNFVVDANYVHTMNNYTNVDQSKLAGITSGATRNIKKEYTLDKNSWVLGNDGYYQTLTLNPMLDSTYPVNVKLGTIGNGNSPTDDEIYAYNGAIYGGDLQESSVEDEGATAVLIYADYIPTSKYGETMNLKIWVEGIVKEVQ